MKIFWGGVEKNQTREYFDLIKIIMSLPKITPKFKTFIRKLLQKGGLKKNNLDSFTDKESMKDFRMAFTHKSYSSEFNYELFEFLGDLTLNWCVGNYIHDHYPDIINVDWLTRMKHALVSKKYLGKMAEKEEFFQFIEYGPEVQEELDVGSDMTQTQIYQDMMEDTVEAFLGALKTVSDRKKSVGVSIALAYNIVSYFLDRLDIDAYDYTRYYDPISRLKEVYDKRHWNFTKALRFHQDAEAGTYTAVIEAYPIEGGKPVVYRKTAPTKGEAKRGVAFQTLTKLAKIYNIRGAVPDPRKRNIWRVKKKSRRPK